RAMLMSLPRSQPPPRAPGARRLAGLDELNEVFRRLTSGQAIPLHLAKFLRDSGGAHIEVVKHDWHDERHSGRFPLRQVDRKAPLKPDPPFEEVHCGSRDDG